MRMQAKLTIFFLITGLLSAASVGGIAYWMVMRDFRQVILDGAFANFQQDMSAYMNAYGGWYEADASEPFHAFVMRRRHGDDRMPFPAPPPRDSIIDRRDTPPFRFLVLDPDGFVLKGVAEHPAGSRVSKAVLAQARPIELEGEVEVLVSPIGDPHLTPEDQAYLQATRHALITGMAVAVLLALLVGLLVGRRMSSTMRALTAAIRAMHNHGVRQQVPVTSRDELGELANAFNRMNRELSEAHQELRELSIRDPLTQLFNRRYFDEQARLAYEQAVRYGQPLTVMLGDLDHFKQINDRFSHAIGDEVLRRTAMLLCESTRTSDVVARYGGEEFVILFPNATLADASQRCEALRREIESQSWQEVASGLQVTMSMGLNADLTQGSAEGMLAVADRNLYAAKDAGRNRVVPTAYTLNQSAERTQRA